jgi:hypothetical protein
LFCRNYTDARLVCQTVGVALGSPRVLEIAFSPFPFFLKKKEENEGEGLRLPKKKSLLGFVGLCARE